MLVYYCKFEVIVTQSRIGYVRRAEIEFSVIEKKNLQVNRFKKTKKTVVTYMVMQTQRKIFICFVPFFSRFL